jgi:hypothetical protein
MAAKKRRRYTGQIIRKLAEGNKLLWRAPDSESSRTRLADSQIFAIAAIGFSRRRVNCTARRRNSSGRAAGTVDRTPSVETIIASNSVSGKAETGQNYMTDTPAELHDGRHLVWSVSVATLTS